MIEVDLRDPVRADDAVLERYWQLRVCKLLAVDARLRRVPAMTRARRRIGVERRRSRGARAGAEAAACCCWMMLDERE